MNKEALIYEYKNNYFIIQRSTQGKKFDERIEATENVALFSKLPLDCSLEKLGADVFRVLENFNIIRPKFESWEFSELNKQFCTWVGARGRKPFDRDSRCVQIYKKEKLEIIPYDNCNKNEWYGPMLNNMGFRNKIIMLDHNSSFEIIGENIKTAFSKATYNPNRKK